jgi:hypothetical protein
MRDRIARWLAECTPARGIPWTTLGHQAVLGLALFAAALVLGLLLIDHVFPHYFGSLESLKVVE